MRKWIVISILIGFIQLGAILGLYKAINKPKPVQPQIEQKVVQTQPEYVLDPYIIQLADEVGINKEDLKKLQVSIVDTNLCGANPDTIACYSNSRLYITVKATQRDRLKQRVALAHEYLHYVWTKDRDALEPELLIVYKQNKGYFDARLASYYASGMKIGDNQFYNELHSFIGTEVSDSKLPPRLLDHYRKYTNRGALPSYI